MKGHLLQVHLGSLSRIAEAFSQRRLKWRVISGATSDCKALLFPEKKWRMLRR